ncbi:G8 domain-containing protein [Roseobacter sp. EG26]|uniref:G8 domain-containing protein n=1 Tax=Roseobacter sp. EG26 TaxID=3412477 RepID=UPI003CE59862
MADGAWTAPATWLGGRVPGNGACVLIPHGRSIIYDNSMANIRLDRVRVDGALIWALDQSTQMLVETVIGTRGSSIRIGTSAGSLPAAHTAEIVISGRDYAEGSFIPTNLNYGNDPKLWGRGFISQGECHMWGKEVLHGSYATAGVPAGATSLTLQEVPTGWQVGDVIVIGSTKFASFLGGDPWESQDEEVTLTDITGNTLTWTGGLTYRHDNQLSGSTYVIKPFVILKEGRNISLRSEVTDPGKSPQFGHLTIMHHHADWQMNYIQTIGMGRTNKALPAGFISNGQFREVVDADTIGSTPADASSNVKGRYSIHFHHTTYGVARGCYTGGSPGWGLVQHSTFMDVIKCVNYDFVGAGLVAEDGDELGIWDSCVSMKARSNGKLNGLRTGPKTAEGPFGEANDTFRYGVGFGYRSRGIISCDNIAIGVPFGHVGYYRENPPENSVGAPSDIKRAKTELRSPQLSNVSNGGAYGVEWSFIDHPILHFTGNVSMGCLMAGQITKSKGTQHHDIQNILRETTSLGCEDGFYLEYIGTYVNEDPVTVGLNRNFGWGAQVGGNTYQVMVHRAFVEGCNEAIRFHDGLDAQAAHDLFDNADEPRWGAISTDHHNSTGPSKYDFSTAPSRTKTGPEVTYIDEDGSSVDFTADPSETFPLVIGLNDQSTLTLVSPGAGDGYKVDNLSNRGVLSKDAAGQDKVWQDSIWATSNFTLGRFLTRHGFWRHSDGNYYAAVSTIISDRLTGRPAKVLKLWLLGYASNGSPMTLAQINATSGAAWADNGPLNYNANPITANDIYQRVDVDGSVTLDVAALSGAAGTGHSSFTLADLDGYEDMEGVNRGRATIDDAAATMLTYTPVKGRSFADFMYVFLYSEGQYKTVKVNFLVTDADNGVTTPVVGTHFAGSDSATANAMDVRMIAKPDTSGRRIVRTEYSTDAGATWKRLVNGWHPMTVTVTTRSNGAALTPGSYSLRLRYKTDYDHTMSPASASDAVTVS